MTNREIVIPQGRVWYDTMPKKYFYEPEFFEEHVLTTASESVIPTAGIGIRLSLPSYNGSFGVLGCHFRTEAIDHLILRVGIKHGEEENGNYIGLPNHLAKFVLEEAVSTLLETPFLGNGILQFDRAAWHKVDSNPFIFRVLTRVIITLMRLEFQHVSNDKIVQILQQSLQNTNSIYVNKSPSK